MTCKEGIALRNLLIIRFRRSTPKVCIQIWWGNQLEQCLGLILMKASDIMGWVEDSDSHPVPVIKIRSATTELPKVPAVRFFLPPPQHLASALSPHHPA